MKLTQLAGRKFGRLTALEYIPGNRRPGRRRLPGRWLCRCDCGQPSTPQAQALLGGTAKSCGCLAREELIARSTKHGHAQTGRMTGAYKAWQAMMQRCYQASHIEYPSYGGRGIQVCDRWRHGFAAFLSDLGDRPSPSHSIDRLDGTGHYEPGNCRWATRVEQARNRSCNRMVTAFGRTQCIAAWAEETGINAGTLRNRIAVGWDAERALREPVGPSRLRSPGAARAIG